MNSNFFQNYSLLINADVLPLEKLVLLVVGCAASSATDQVWISDNQLAHACGVTEVKAIQILGQLIDKKILFLVEGDFVEKVFLDDRYYKINFAQIPQLTIYQEVN